MKNSAYFSVPVLFLCLLLLLTGCGVHDQNSEEDKEGRVSESAQIRPDDDEIVWSEVNENGVDVDLLMENTDREVLEYIARQLQDLCDQIGKKGEEDKNYWLTGQWYADATESARYQNVVSLGRKAMKPLLLILCRSDTSGMYEWICSKALEEVSGFDFSDTNNGAGWKNSEEFLEMFIDRITEQKR